MVTRWARLIIPLIIGLICRSNVVANMMKLVIVPIVEWRMNMLSLVSLAFIPDLIQMIKSSKDKSMQKEFAFYFVPISKGWVPKPYTCLAKIAPGI